MKRQQIKKLFDASVEQVIDGTMSVTQFRRELFAEITKAGSSIPTTAAAHFNSVLSFYLHQHPEHKEILNPGHPDDACCKN